jgi:1-phosphofructokinase
VIRTVTLNPAVDRTVEVPRFSLDAVNRISAERRDAGGKGINVSVALAALGARSVAYGLLGGAAGAFIRGFLRERGIESRFAEIAGETRTNLKIVDPEPAPHGPERTGSGDPDGQPPGAGGVPLRGPRRGRPAGPLRKRRLGAAGGLRLLDTPRPDSGCPDAPGRRRPRPAAGQPPTDRPEAQHRRAVPVGRKEAVRRKRPRPLGRRRCRPEPPGRRHRAGGGLHGRRRALFVDARATIRAHGVPVAVRSTVGAGDSLVAALARGWSAGTAWNGSPAGHRRGDCRRGHRGLRPPHPEAVASFEPRSDTSIYRMET